MTEPAPSLQVSFLPAELARWDQLEEAQIPEALVLPFFSDERPLRGAAGLVDWRLCGRLSRMLKAGRVRGALGEATLYPPPSTPTRRVPFPRIVLFGLGALERTQDQAAVDALAERASRALADVIAGLGLERVAVVPPGRSTGRLGARRALELLLSALGAPGRDRTSLRHLVVVESAAGMKEAADLARLPAAAAAVAGERPTD